MSANRFTNNPLITPADVPPSRPGYEVICAFNPAVTRLGDEILLLMRVAERPIQTDPRYYLVPIFNPVSGELEIKPVRKDDPRNNFSDSRLIGTPDGLLLTSISHFRLARSKDGLHFSVDPTPALFPVTPYETYGVEDARITRMGDRYLLNYSAVSDRGICVPLAATHDFVTFERLGIIFQPDNKDVVLLPEKVNGLYWALHRPSTAAFSRPNIWVASSPDLLRWGDHHLLMPTRPNRWDGERIGGSAVPFRVEQGWLEIYHGALNNRYCLGAALLDANDPARLLARSAEPFLMPEAPYEKQGFFGEVVFCCGCLVEGERVKIYYGASDEFICGAEIALEEILAGLVYS